MTNPDNVGGLRYTDHNVMNGLLCDFATRWKMDGDYIRCRTCKRPQLTSYGDNDFPHASDCRDRNSPTMERRPWQTYVALLSPLGRAEPAGPVASLNPIGYVDLASWQTDWNAGESFFTDYQDEDTQPIYTQAQMEHAIELCRAAPAGGVECFVREMRTSKGSEFFVVVKLGDRELTPHMYTERWKAEYDVASWQHLLCGAPKPDILAYGPSAPFDSSPAGSGEVAKALEVVEAYGKLYGQLSGHTIVTDLLNDYAALLRKLQQGADGQETKP